MNLNPGPIKNTLQVNWCEISEAHEGQRVDNFLINQLKGVPKSRIYRILRKGEVRVNKSRVKPEYKLCIGDVVRIPPIRTAERKPTQTVSQSLHNYLSNAVLYEDKGLMVLNKPAGLAVHGGDGVNLGLIEALRQVRTDCPFLELVHRLDKDTSGCLMVAKKRPVLRFLQSKLKERDTFSKHYLALTVGAWKSSVSQVDAPLAKTDSAGGGQIVRVIDSGKPSLTRIGVLERFKVNGLGQFTLIEAQPVTGRTHQIRVHAQYLNHPLVGDDKYGVDQVNKDLKEFGFKRMFLHAFKITLPVYRAADSEVQQDKCETITVEAPLADDLSTVLSRLDPVN